MEPLISIQLTNDDASYRPGDVLECDYQIDAVPPEEVHAVEASVLWYTEGKGEEDMAVHYFQRRVLSDDKDRNLCSLYRFQTPLPNCPLTYDGQIVKVHWCVRVRAFLGRGKETYYERPFHLGFREQKG